MTTFSDRWTLLQSRVLAAAPQASPTIVAVGKFHSAEAYRAAYALGVRDFGENYVQEWRRKVLALADLPGIRWHFIGRLQRNKIKLLLEPLPASHTLLVHTVESKTVAEELARRATEKVSVLMQVEVSAADKNKGGIPQNDALELCSFIVQNPELSLKGFMGIGPAGASVSELSTLYPQWMSCVSRCWQHFPAFACEPLLSLGMSDDLETALKYGSNLLRIGTALFGERPPKSTV